MKNFKSAILFAAAVPVLLLHSCGGSSDIGDPVYGMSVEAVPLEFGGEDDSEKLIYVITNIKGWSAEASADWIRTTPDMEKKTVAVTVDDNEDLDNPRSGTVTITADGFSETVAVSQLQGSRVFLFDDLSAIYRGDIHSAGTGAFGLRFSSGEFDENGVPSGKASLLNIECVSLWVPGIYAPEISEGDYYLTQENAGEAYTFTRGIAGNPPSGTYYHEYDENGAASTPRQVTGGSFTISKDGDMLSFDARLIFSDNAIMKFRYDGAMPVENTEEISVYGEYLDMGSIINYDLWLYSGKLNKNKEIAGNGFKLVLECWNEDNSIGSYTIPEGEYLAGDAVAKADLTFSRGAGQATMSGSHMVVYTEGSRTGAVAVTGGTVVVEKVDGVYNITLDITAADGTEMKCELTSGIKFTEKK